MTSTYDPKYASKWRYDKNRGITRTVDAGPTVAHIQKLLDAGASLRAVADQAGCRASTLSSIMRGEHHKVRRITAECVGRVTLESIFQRSGDEDFVPQVGARRRVRALHALGHTAPDIARAAGGFNHRIIHNIANSPGRWVSRTNYERVVRAYEALSHVEGTSNLTRGRARNLGYAPPMAWDDETIDDPNAVAAVAPDPEDDAPPDEVAIARVMAGEPFTLTREETVEALRRMVELGMSDIAISEKFRVTPRTILRWRQANNIESRWAA